MFRNKFIHIIVFLIGFSAFSQVNFTTKLSKNQLGLNERVKVEFSVDKDGDNLYPQLLKTSELLGVQANQSEILGLTVKDHTPKLIHIFYLQLKKALLKLVRPPLK